jgi:hypothetical protein
MVLPGSIGNSFAWQYWQEVCLVGPLAICIKRIGALGAREQEKHGSNAGEADCILAQV